MIDSTVIAAKVIGAVVVVAAAKFSIPRVKDALQKRRIAKVCREADHLLRTKAE